MLNKSVSAGFIMLSSFLAHAQQMEWMGRFCKQSMCPFAYIMGK